MNMSVIFDQDGNAVNSIPEPNTENEGKVVICPNCKSITVYPSGMISNKTKPRVCGRCGTYLGDW